jgi:hypothetical protein
MRLSPRRPAAVVVLLCAAVACRHEAAPPPTTTHAVGRWSLRLDRAFHRHDDGAVTSFTTARRSVIATNVCAAPPPDVAPVIYRKRGIRAEVRYMAHETVACLRSENETLALTMRYGDDEGGRKWADAVWQSAQLRRNVRSLRDAKVDVVTTPGG